MELVTVTAAIAGLKNSIDLAKAAISARDELKLAEMQQAINDRVIEVQNAALALQEKQSAARDQIDSLKDELRDARAQLRELEQRQAEREKYELHAAAASGFVYRAKASSDGPEHCICQPCFDGPERRKVVLQYSAAAGTGRMHTPAVWWCPVCKTAISG